MVFIRDPCGVVCLIMTYVCVLYADYVVVRWIVLATGLSHSLWGAVNVVAFNIIVFLLLISHFMALTSDPGVVPLPSHRIDFSDARENKIKKKPRKVRRNNGKDFCDQDQIENLLEDQDLEYDDDEIDEDWTVCTRCEMYRPPRAHHCRTCKRCIRRMDHHCPWINNCVGEWNQKYFLLFLFYVGLLSAYSISLVAFSWYNPCPECPKDIYLKQTRILHSVILVLESILFGMFVIAIGCDQAEAIFTDETLVEQAKRQGPFRPQKPKMVLLAEVCGGRGMHPLLWLIPYRSQGNHHLSNSSSNVKMANYTV